MAPTGASCSVSRLRPPIRSARSTSSSWRACCSAAAAGGGIRLKDRSPRSSPITCATRLARPRCSNGRPRRCRRSCGRRSSASRRPPPIRRRRHAPQSRGDRHQGQDRRPDVLRPRIHLAVQPVEHAVHALPDYAASATSHRAARPRQRRRAHRQRLRLRLDHRVVPPERRRRDRRRHLPHLPRGRHRAHGRRRVRSSSSATSRTCRSASAVAGAVMAYESFHHLPDRQAAMRSYDRALEPGGRVALAEPGAAHEEAQVSVDVMKKYGILEQGMELPDVIGTPRARRSAASSSTSWSARARPIWAQRSTDSFVRAHTVVEGNLFTLVKGGAHRRIPASGPAGRSPPCAERCGDGSSVASRPCSTPGPD